MCGTASWEWEENRFAYEPTEVFCHGCYQKSIYSDTEHRSLPGTTVSLTPVTDLHKAEREVYAERMRELERRDQQQEKELADGGGPGPHR